MEQSIRDKITGEVQYRTLRLDRSAVNEEARTVEISFSSEKPCERWWGVEILDHSPSSVRMGRLTDGAPLLFAHDSDEHLGVVESARIDSDRIGRAVVRFSKSEDAEVKFRDVLDGILTKISVGYMVHEMVLEKKDGDTSTYRCTDWEPIEVSFVTIPADNTVGVGRNHETHIIPKEGGNTMGENTTTPAAPAEVKREDVLREERDRVTQIEAMASKYTGRITNMGELREKAIHDGWTPDLFKGAIADRIVDTKPLDPPEIGLTDKEAKAFSFARAIAHLAGMKVDAAFEVECSRAVAEKLGMRPKGILVPFEVQGRDALDYRKHPDYQQFSRRDLTVGSATAGGNLVGTNLLAGSYIDLLRNKMLAYQLGARQLSGLVGNIAIPRQTTAGTAVWETEATGITSESAQAWDQVSMSPNEVGAYTEISHKLLLQATPGVEGLIQDDIARVLAIAIDLAFFHGSGGTQPTGVVGASGVGSVAGAGLSWDAVVEFETDVETGNALAGSLAYVSTPAIRGTLKTRPKVAGFPEFLMDRDGRVNGYPFFSSNQISAGYMMFGDWTQGLIGEWGVLELTVNPFIKDVEGLIRVVGRQAVDVAFRHGASFSISSTVS